MLGPSVEILFGNLLRQRQLRAKMEPMLEALPASVSIEKSDLSSRSCLPPVVEKFILHANFA